MAWGEIKVEEQRKLFIGEYKEVSLAPNDLCNKFRISRKNAYKWIERFKEKGADRLKDKSRARLSQPLAADDRLMQQIIEVRGKYPAWGPKKSMHGCNNISPKQYGLQPQP